MRICENKNYDDFKVSERGEETVPSARVKIPMQW